MRLFTLPALALGLTLAAATLPGSGRAAPVPARIHVLARGLDQPKKLTVAADGSLIVALSGNGVVTRRCAAGHERACVNRSGAVDHVTTTGQVSSLEAGLPSLCTGGSSADATGPAQAVDVDGQLQVLFQNGSISARTGRNRYGSLGSRLGDLVGFSASDPAGRAEASFGPFEAEHNPDRGAGSDVAYGEERATDSDPYAIVAYRGGYAVVDAGANDVLFVSPTGGVSVLAVLPTIRERAAAGTFGSAQKTAIWARAQAVPDSVTVGPDGALYVGELGGLPFAAERSSVYRVVPGHASTVYATGLTAIEDLAFGPHGRLYVLELDRRGLTDPALSGTGRLAPGALIRVESRNRHATVASTGLSWPTGLAISAGVAYMTDYGDDSARAGGHGGEVVSVSLG
jgi:hypothetical protein